MSNWPFILSACLLASLAVSGRAEADGFEIGDVIGGDSVGNYVVLQVDTHPEFHRIDLEDSAGSTFRVEIMYADPSRAGASTVHYAIQPTPDGVPIPDELFEALRGALLEMESQPDHVPFVNRTSETELNRQFGPEPAQEPDSASPPEEAPERPAAEEDDGEWAAIVAKIRWSYPYLAALLVLRVVWGVAWGRRRKTVAET